MLCLATFSLQSPSWFRKVPNIKGGGKRGHNVADTLLRTQMFPRLPVRATFVADTNFVSETQKMFPIFIRNILCPQQMFPRLRGMDTEQMFCVPLVCPPKKHHEQQCVRNIVSPFATTLTLWPLIWKYCKLKEKVNGSSVFRPT